LHVWMKTYILDESDRKTQMKNNICRHSSY
jgi:hypothetical protein